MDNNYTNTDIFKSTECPSDALLLSYVKETISNEDKRMVELHLIDCEMCNDMVEGYQNMQPENIEKHLTTLNAELDHAVLAQTNKGGNSSKFKWYYAVAALLIIGLTGILYNFYFNSIEEHKVADLPMPHQNEISVTIDTAEKVETKETLDNPAVKVVKALEPIQSVAIESKNTREAMQDDGFAVSESNMNEVPPAPVEQKMEEKPVIAFDEEIATKSLTDNTTFGNTTIAQPAFTAAPNNELISNGASTNFTSPPNNLSVISLTETDSKKLNFSLKKENAAKSKFKAAAPTEAKSEEGKDKQEDMAQIEKAVSDKKNTLQEANQLLQQKKYNEALVKYNQYLKTHPKSCEALNGAAQCYDAINKISEAIVYYTTLSQLKCAKQSDAAYLKLSELYIKNKQSNEAKQMLQKAMQSKYLDIAEQAKKELDKL